MLSENNRDKLVRLSLNDAATQRHMTAFKQGYFNTHEDMLCSLVSCLARESRDWRMAYEDMLRKFSPQPPTEGDADDK